MEKEIYLKRKNKRAEAAATKKKKIDEIFSQILQPTWRRLSAKTKKTYFTKI